MHHLNFRFDYEVQKVHHPMCYLNYFRDSTFHKQLLSILLLVEDQATIIYCAMIEVEARFS